MKQANIHKDRSHDQGRRKFIRECSSIAVLTSMGMPVFADAMDLNNQGWQKAAAMPYALQEIYCATLNNSIHLAGGFIFGPASADVSMHHLHYDIERDVWQSRASIPEPRHHLQMVSHQGKIFGLGGFVMNSPNAVWVMQDQTWLYDPEKDRWETRSKSPARHGETVAASIGDRVHLVGGRTPKTQDNAVYSDHRDTDHHLVYDPGSDGWELAAPALISRNSAAGAMIGDLWHVVGGRTVSGGNVDNLEVYDPKEDKWRNATPMPKAQGGLAATALGGKLYAFGGEYFNDGGGVFKECWVYEPTKDRWAPSDPMLTPRHGLAGASYGNRIYAIGGAKKPGGRETSDLVEFWQAKEKK